MLRRAALTRKTPLHYRAEVAPRASKEAKEQEERKPHKCKQCKKALPAGQWMLHDECIGAWWEANREKLAAKVKRAQAKERSAEKAQDRAKRQAMKRIPELIADAQAVFNAFIRERDAGQPCICCGRPLAASGVGGGFDAGHYRSTGSASHLRFDERNCHGQAKVCNRYGAGRAVDYRIGLIGRIGLAEVEALEASNEPAKWTREGLIAIRDTYRAKLRELKKGEV